MTIQEIIKGNNQAMVELYPSGENHKGTKLKHYKLGGNKIYAINESQAQNIYHQAKIDAK